MRLVKSELLCFSFEAAWGNNFRALRGITGGVHGVPIARSSSATDPWRQGPWCMLSLKTL